jgi:CYTH domain-containing protein/predicted enzyme related to lactoylglutathione lyase
MSSRVAGEGRYARLEREQRWVLAGVPTGLQDPVSIADLYLAGTRLRLRRMATEAAVTYKLGQKVRRRAASPEVVKLTNIYLSESEYATLARLGGAELRKTRWRWMLEGRSLAVDVFQDRLRGLVLAEVELSADEARLPSPASAVADVTDDDRFSGGNLAEADSEEVERLLAFVANPSSVAPPVMTECGMAITGAHVVLYTSEPEALRAVFRDVFGWRHVDAGDGWLIFALPPAELGIHPTDAEAGGTASHHQLTLMCDDLASTIEELKNKGIEVRGDPQNAGFGIVTTLVLPGGVDVMLYQPRHQTAI